MENTDLKKENDLLKRVVRVIKLHFDFSFFLFSKHSVRPSMFKVSKHYEVLQFLLAILRTKRMKLPALSRSFSAPL